MNEYNSRGDVVEKWNTDGCPYCGTKVNRKQENNYEYLYLERKPTNSPQESEYQQTFNRLSTLIAFYKPYIDKTPDTSDDKISVEITFR